jgi:V8-like Glu-specific endopeptidase
MSGVGERQGLERELGVLREAETRCIDPSGFSRKSVTDTTKTPYKWICIVDTKADTEGYEKHGTGLLISPRHVVTAAHNIWKKGAKFEKVVVRPGAHATWSGRAYESQNRHVLRAYRRTEGSANDIGVIELRKDVTFDKSKSGLNLRYFGDAGPRALAYTMGLYPAANIVGLPSTLSDKDLLNLKVTSIGYPGDKRGSFDSMFEFDGMIRTLSRERAVAHVAMDACSGQSGSPVFLSHDKDNYLIGLAASINPKTGLAQVALLTAARVNSLFGAIIDPSFTGPLPAKDD